jgi:phosphopantothenoylcysteine decarboxylase/phosphopantothenate--cysteine ligase
MGYALAQAAEQLGGEVTLISGPVSLNTPANVTKIDVVSAAQMHQQAMAKVHDVDIFIGCAAVADYRPVAVADQKIKKNDDEMTITMVKNPDILRDVSFSAQRPFCVGFAAETQDVETYARGKLQRKKLDLIAANNVAITGQGFNSDQNALTLYWDNGQLELPLADKGQLATKLMIEILNHYHNKSSAGS